MTSKYFKLLRDSFNSFNLSNIAKQSESWLCNDGVTVQVERKKIHCLVFTFYKKIWISNWSFHIVVLQRATKKCTKIWIASAVIVLLIKPFVLWRSRQLSPLCLLTFPISIMLSVQAALFCATILTVLQLIHPVLSCSSNYSPLLGGYYGPLQAFGLPEASTQERLVGLHSSLPIDWVFILVNAFGFCNIYLIFLHDRVVSPVLNL